MAINSIKVCPQCGSEDVIGDGSLIELSQNASICRKCGFKGLIFPEKTKLKMVKK